MAELFETIRNARLETKLSSIGLATFVSGYIKHREAEDRVKALEESQVQAKWRECHFSLFRHWQIVRERLHGFPLGRCLPTLDAVAKNGNNTVSIPTFVTLSF